MKKAKKFLALMLAVAMVLSMCVSVFAENSDGESYTRGSITVTNPIEGETYKAYKIFDVTYNLGGEGTTDDKYAYTIAPEWVEDVVAYATPANTTLELEGDWTTTTANGLTVTKNAIGGYNVTIDDTFSAPDFGEKMAALTSEKTAITPKEGTAKFEDLDLGYYMVQPTTANSLVSLTTTDKDVTITDKNEKPVVDKSILEDGKVLECKDKNPETHEHTDECYKDVQYKEDHTTASVGDKVEYELDTKVPDMTGYETYFFVVNDTMSAGLTFNEDVEITLDGVKLEADEYTVKVTGGGDEKTNIRIVFKDMKQYWSNDDDEDMAGKPIVIKYSATVDEDAVMGTDGNTNSAKIEYSNNPNIVPEYQNPDDPTDDDPFDDPEFDPNDPLDPKYKHNQTEETTDDPTGVSASDVVTVYTAELDITKVDGNGGASLTGAKFKIEGEKLNVSIVNKTIFKVATDGTWYRLKDGTYTQDIPVGKGTEPVPTYEAMPDNFEPVTYTKLTGDAAVPGAGLYYSTDDGAPKTLITDPVAVPDGAQIYQPTYNTPGLYYSNGEEYKAVTEDNAAELAQIERVYYKQILHKQSDLYEDTNVKYNKVEVIDKYNASETYTAEGFVNSNGKISFKGLAEGTYYLTELVAPDGYNLLKAPVEVVVALVAGETEGSYKFQATIDGADAAISEANKVISFNIVNNQGIELPETGGIGTVLFIAIGAVLFIAAGIVLTAKKRLYNEG